MTDHSFDEDMSRRLYDPSHPLYSHRGHRSPPGSQPGHGEAAEPSPWVRRLVYSIFGVAAAYFVVILIFGTH